MASWAEFAADAPELATYVQARLTGAPAYLATIRPDGGPRVHPITAIVGDEALYVFMFDTSPKGKDLRRDGRYALHCTVENHSGGGGEVIVRGEAVLVDDAATRAKAAEAASYSPRDAYILFQLDIRYVLVTTYENGEPIRQRWQAPATTR